MVGVIEGMLVGLDDGNVEGDCVGDVDGSTLGYDDGYIDGYIEGSFEGDKVGFQEGRVDGVSLGIVVSATSAGCSLAVGCMNLLPYANCPRI